MDTLAFLASVMLIKNIETVLEKMQRNRPTKSLVDLANNLSTQKVIHLKEKANNKVCF